MIGNNELMCIFSPFLLCERKYGQIVEHGDERTESLFFFRRVKKAKENMFKRLLIIQITLGV